MAQFALKITKIYRNNITPLINRNADNLDALISSVLTKNSVAGVVNSGEIATAYVNNQNLSIKLQIQFFGLNLFRQV